jgi:cytochrome c oxidase assembly protein subunit 11
MQADKKQKNAKLVKVLVLVVIGMFGFGYALVPLYDVLCDLTGLNGKSDKLASQESAYQADPNRELIIEFLTTINENTPLLFRAETKQLKIHPGKFYTVNFYAENKSDKVITSQAIPSFSPGRVAKYVEKAECFCFKQQVFQPGESKTMPMRFVVKADLPQEHKIITLSYTFFDNTKAIAQK